VPSASGSVGGMAGNQIQINNNQLGTAVSGGSYTTNSITITVNNQPFQIFNNSFVTPAEYVAAFQRCTLAAQPIILGSGGAAIGGSILIQPSNLPAGGFTVLNIPSGLQANVSGAALSVAGGTATVGGQLVYTASGALTAANISVGGTIQTTGGSALTLTASTNITTTASGSISTTGNLVMNLNNASLFNNGTISATSANGGPGNIVIQSTGNMTINPVGTISVSPTAAGGGNGGTILISAPNGTLTLGAGTVSANATTGGNFSGGSITVLSSALSLPSSSNLLLTANGVGSANGGTISIETTGSTSSINLGSAGNQMQLSANSGASGGNGGSHIRVRRTESVLELRWRFGQSAWSDRKWWQRYVGCRRDFNHYRRADRCIRSHRCRRKSGLVGPQRCGDGSRSRRIRLELDACQRRIPAGSCRGGAEQRRWQQHLDFRWFGQRWRKLISPAAVAIPLPR